jgi:hypothetical protein
MSAARVKHLKNQMQYDEGSEMDVRNEIKFVVITVGLPIGSKCYIPLYPILTAIIHFC